MFSVTYCMDGSYANVCVQQVTQIDTDLKNKSQAYNGVRGNLQNLERKAA